MDDEQRGGHRPSRAHLAPGQAHVRQELEHGGEDLNDEGDTWEVLTSPKDYEAVMNALTAAKIKPEHAEVTMISSTYTKLEGTQAAQMMRLLEAIDDLDDTQAVYSNFDMDEESVPA